MERVAGDIHVAGITLLREQHRLRDGYAQLCRHGVVEILVVGGPPERIVDDVGSLKDSVLQVSAVILDFMRDAVDDDTVLGGFAHARSAQLDELRSHAIFFSKFVDAHDKCRRKAILPPAEKANLFHDYAPVRPVGMPGLRLPSIHSVRGGSPRLGDTCARFGNKVPDYRFQVARFLIYAQLPVRAGAFVHDGVHVFDGAAAAQVIDDVIHEFQQFGNQLAHGHFGFLAEVDQFSINAVSRRSPLVLFDERAAVQPPTHIALVEAVELHNDGLRERGDSHCFLYSRGDVEHAEFQGAKSGMWPDVPPDLFPVVDAIQL